MLLYCIDSTHFQLAALSYDGLLYTWGYSATNDIRTLDFILTDVDHVFSTRKAMVALFKNKTLYSWGDRFSGGCNKCNTDCPSTKTCTAYDFGIRCGNNVNSDPTCIPDEGISNVVSVFTNQGAFAALDASNNLFCIGGPDQGGGCCSKINNAKICRTISNVKTVTPNQQAFAALLLDGTVVSFGKFEFGGCIQPSTQGFAFCQPLLSNIQAIFSTAETFAAITANGNVTVWGKIQYVRKILFP